MKRYVSYVILTCALIIALLALFGDDSFSKLSAMRRGLEFQREKNAELDRDVKGLRREVMGLKSDDRTLEKAARNELGLARPNELVFIFEDQKQ